MRSFFRSDRLQAPYKSAGRVHSCVSCRLYENAISPRMPPFGEFRKQMMVIGEAPGEVEDRRGRPWQGPVGQLLQRQYRELGVNLFEDCVTLNAVNCRPMTKKGANRAPSSFEIACCRMNVLRYIEEYKPKIIILHGGAAITSLLGHRMTGELGGVTKWRGWTIPDRTYNAWLCPTYHPSYVQRQRETTAEVEVIWREDLQRAISKLSEPLPEQTDDGDSVVVTTDEKEIGKLLADVLRSKPHMLAFDIETTGLKPYHKELHKIASIAICADAEMAYAFPMPKGKLLTRLARLLTHPRIGKVAANLKFEHIWLATLHGIEVHPWLFDTMQAAHVLDNRPGITGLKFQAYVRFGVLGYDDQVSPLLKGRGKGVSVVNDLASLSTDDPAFHEILLYNGLDALYTYRLAQLQMQELDLQELRCDE